MQNKINELNSQKNSINNEHHRAVNKIKNLKEKKIYEESYEELYKNVENFFDFEEKKIKYDFNGFDEDGIHNDTGKYYDLNGFNSYGINARTNDKYNPEGFDIKGFHKDTKTLYDPNDFNINGNHVIINDKYNPNGFNKNGFHKDTKTLYDPNGFDKNGFHKDTKTLYDPNGFDKYGLHKDTKTLYDPNGFDKYGLHKDTKTLYDPNGFDKYGHDIYDNRKTSTAKSFKDQKGKGHVNLPIASSKIYTNNSSKVKQLINDLYDNEQITKQVYNNIIKAITYKNDS